MTNIEFANALRKLADFYEANPEMPQPDDINIWAMANRTKFFRAIKSLGSFKKVEPKTEADEFYYIVEKDFAGLALKVTTTRRDVCRKVTKQVSVEVWDCEEPLLEKLAAMESTQKSKSIEVIGEE